MSSARCVILVGALMVGAGPANAAEILLLRFGEAGGVALDEVVHRTLRGGLDQDSIRVGPRRSEWTGTGSRMVARLQALAVEEKVDLVIHQPLVVQEGGWALKLVAVDREGRVVARMSQRLRWDHLRPDAVGLVQRFAGMVAAQFAAQRVIASRPVPPEETPLVVGPEPVATDPPAVVSEPAAEEAEPPWDLQLAVGLGAGVTGSMARLRAVTPSADIALDLPATAQFAGSVQLQVAEYLGMDFAIGHGQSRFSHPAVRPTVIDVATTRSALTVALRLPFGLSLAAGGIYEAARAPRQLPFLVVPGYDRLVVAVGLGFGKDDLRRRGLAFRLTGFVLPVGLHAETPATSGEGATVFGFSVHGRVRYQWLDLLHDHGGLYVGLDAGAEALWVNYRGIGTRTSMNGTPVEGAAEQRGSYRATLGVGYIWG